MDSDFARAVRRTALSCGRGFVLAGAALLGIPLFIATVLSLAFLPLGIGVLLTPAALMGVRGLANQHRQWARDWFGVAIPSPYRPLPKEAPDAVAPLRYLRWVLTDPATWRDVLWVLINIPVGLLLGLLPVSLIIHGFQGILVRPVLWMIDFDEAAIWLVTVPVGVVLLVLSLTVSRQILLGHALFCRVLLAPSAHALTERVNQLTESRSQAVDASAAELRRIERDLHDGAQARLVALGINIGLAEQMVKNNPEMALTLLAEARESSGRALSDLRDLVRGIHPPVLAERGLDGAVQALALSMPVSVDVDVRLPGRLPAPVESAAYFAVAEALANIVKHSAATQAWVQLWHDRSTLVAVVCDNGVGGADMGGGSGLRGVEQRLAAFDGTIVVTSPLGGPTVVTMELPCELSSEKTSPSFETG